MALVADVCTDVTHTWRLLSRHRVFALTAVLTLALGIGATTALFAVIDGVLLRPLPWPGADRLVRLSEWHPGARAAFPGPRLSDLTAAAWAASPVTIEAIAAWSSRTYTVTLGDEPRRLPGAEVSPSLFRLLRTPPAVGRFFVEAESQERAPAVVVLSAGLWRQAFAGDPQTVGRTVLIDRRPHLVVGVAPAGFAFPDAEARLWTPYAVPASPGNDGSMRVFSALSRLRPGASAVQAEAEGTAAARSVTRPMVADLIFGKGRAVEVRVRPLQEEMTASVRPALFLLASGVGVLLLVACANVANLLLSAGVTRQRELAVRAALGAGRRRLLRQLLTESLALSLAGGALGVLLASSLVSALPRLAPADFPRLDGVRLDSRVVASAVLLSLVSGVLAGIVPALRASGRDLQRAMRDGGLGATASHGQAFRVGLLVGEAALSVVLLVGAGLLVRSFARLVRVDPGYDPDNVLIAQLVFTEEGDSAARRRASIDALLERLRASPGVVAAGAGNMAPFVKMTAVASATLPWPGPDGQPIVARARTFGVTPGYAEALGLRLREGRLLSAGDAVAKPRPLLVSDAFVRAYLRDGRATLGRQMTGAFSADEREVSEIVGVVGAVLKDGLDAEPQPEVWVPAGPENVPTWVSLVVRTADDPLRLLPTFRRLARETDPSMAVEAAGALARQVSSSVGKPRFVTTVFAAFSGLALALAAIGLFGALSYNVSARKRELGIRAALGAGRGDLVGLVVRQGLAVTVAGLTLGLPAAAAASRVMAGLLFGVSPWDAVAFSVAALLVLLVAGAACIIPARRAASTEPARVLRTE